MKKGNRVVISKLKEKLRKIWEKIPDKSTDIIVNVVAGVVAGVILLPITYSFNSLYNNANSKAVDVNTIQGYLHSNDATPKDIVSGNTNPDPATADNDIPSIMVTIYFDKSDNLCKAFFITLLNDTLDIDIVLPEAYSSFVADKALGEYAFTDICIEPSRVYGYASLGVGHAFYCEEYYFDGKGNYQNFYFAVLDYNIVNSTGEFSKDLLTIQPEINPMKDVVGLPKLDSLTELRDKYYPNTFGISSLNSYQTFSLLGGVYTEFDSQLLGRKCYLPHTHIHQFNDWISCSAACAL